MDFVLRDAQMTGYSPRAFDLDRLLHYSFFSPQGLTIHDRGIDALVRFIGVRAELFRSVYFHRTVRAIDLALKDLFVASKEWLFPGNPLERLDEYLYFTETSLLVDTQRWATSTDPAKREIGQQWRDLVARKVPWVTVCSRNLVFAKDDSEQASIFSDAGARRAQAAAALAARHRRRAPAGRYRPHDLPPAHGRPGRRAELPVRLGQGARAAADRPRVLPPAADQPPPVPRLCPHDRARRRKSPLRSIRCWAGRSMM